MSITVQALLDVTTVKQALFTWNYSLCCYQLHCAMKESKNCPSFQTALKTTPVLQEYSHDSKPVCVKLQSRNGTETFSRGSWHFTAFIAHFVQYLLKQPPLCHLKSCGVHSCLAARYLCIIKLRITVITWGGGRRESKSDCYHVRFSCSCFRLLPFKNIQT